MRLDDEQTKKLLEYAGPVRIRQLSLNMALTRLKTIYRANPSSATISKCTAEINAIFDKFAIIMQSDFDWITKL
ncbi:MAG: hypothetical protein LBT23_08620 [Synergistaceae bacterium]|nr:hypothetical protein [Synergistaceae bacterium]